MDNLDIILQKLHFERYVIPQLNTIKRTTYLNQFPYWARQLYWYSIWLGIIIKGR
jgi:hypothetical protein